MKNIKQILQEILKEIEPDKDYEKEIFERLSSIIKKINRGQDDFKAVLGGSGAKGTWLKTFDADIFVLFDYKKYKDKSGQLSDILEKALKGKFKKVARLHGSRDYFQINKNNFTFEIVPILSIKKAEQAKNITDVSPLHSRWVVKHRKLAREMKLTKQFCQAQSVYGAESYIRGFSGYVCEVLTAYYGSFINLLRNAAKWQTKAVIDIERYYRRKDVFRIVNISKLESPLIVIDPVQKDRNAAAALSKEKFEAFKKAAYYFLKNPSKGFFIKKDLKSTFFQLKSNSNKLITVNVAPLAGKIDVVGSKLLKSYQFLLQQLQKHGFKAIKTEWDWDKSSDAIFYFLFDRKPLPKDVEVKGPPLKIEKHVQHFRKLHKRTFRKSGSIYAIDKRKYCLPEDLLKILLKDNYVKERARSTKFAVK